MADGNQQGQPHPRVPVEQPSSGRNDQDIGQDIRDLMAMDSRVNPANVVVNTTRGVVLLSGVVTSRESREAAEEIARGVPGVTRVINQIIVVPTAEGERP